MKPTLLILAAGMGSRYGGLKQADPVGPNGEVMLDYSIYDAIRAGFGKIVFVIREDFAEQFKTGVAARFADRIPVGFAYQALNDLPAGFTVPEGREKPWGTTQAILSARHEVGENFCAINADDFYGREAFALMADYLADTDPTSQPAHYAMAGYELKATLSEHGSVARGICRTDEGGFLKSVEELTKIIKTEGGAENCEDDGTSTKLTGDELVSMNFWGFTPQVFGHLDQLFRDFLVAKGGELKSECYIPTCVDTLIQKGQATVKVLKTTSQWFGVTYREDKPIVQQSIERLIASGDYPKAI